MGVVADDHRIDIRIYGTAGESSWRDYLAFVQYRILVCKIKDVPDRIYVRNKVDHKFRKRLTVFTEAASIMGLSVVGALIATSVKITTALNFKVGEVALNLQTDILDKIMPSLLPVLLTLLVYKLLGNKNGQLQN